MNTTSIVKGMKTEINELREEINRLKEMALNQQVVIFKHEINIEPKTDCLELPPVIPKDAREVLLYISKRTGWCKGCDQAYDITLTTQYEGNDVSRAKFTYFEYEQNAWAYNSDNIWLTITPERKVYIKGGKIPISIMGYKC